MRSTRLTIAALALALPLSLAACGSSDADPGAASSAPMASSAAPSPSDAMTADMACDAVRPGLRRGTRRRRRLVLRHGLRPGRHRREQQPAAVDPGHRGGEAGLGETLNTAKDITVFAPTNDAFAALDKATMDKAMADPKGLLTTVLTNHVVEGRHRRPEMLAGDHKTLAGTTITVEGSGEDFTVGKAKVVCGNVQTANATVYIIDGVLLPAS